MSPVRIAPACIASIPPRCPRLGYGPAARCAAPCFRYAGNRSPPGPPPLPPRLPRLHRRSFRGSSHRALSRPGPRPPRRNLPGPSRPRPAQQRLRPVPPRRRHPPRRLVHPVRHDPPLRRGAGRPRCQHPRPQQRRRRQRALGSRRSPRLPRQGRPGRQRRQPGQPAACPLGLPPRLEAGQPTRFSPRIPRSRPVGSPAR
jgi:hypothetical protein